jgi:hypothetical protein
MALKKYKEALILLDESINARIRGTREYAVSTTRQ